MPSSTRSNIVIVEAPRAAVVRSSDPRRTRCASSWSAAPAWTCTGRASSPAPRPPGPCGSRLNHTATFGTTTPDLLGLRDWLVELGVGAVAMEAGGVYWKPVHYLLEDAIDQVLVVNARHVKQVPGRKTGQSDADWLCQLVGHGLLRSGFVPPAPIRDLRDLTRRRRTLVGERQRETNRLHKVLEDAGTKLNSVASDVLGVSGPAMLGALIEGTHDPAALAELARGRMRAKLPALERALTGRFRDHHAFLVSDILAHLDYLEERIAALGRRIEEKPVPFGEAMERWMSVAGIGRRTAEVLVAELGAELCATFPSPRHLASCGLAPGTHEGAGKRKDADPRR